MQLIIMSGCFKLLLSLFVGTGKEERESRSRGSVPVEKGLGRGVVVRCCPEEPCEAALVSGIAEDSPE